MSEEIHIAHFSNEFFVLETQKQLYKDFEKSGCSFPADFLERVRSKEEIEFLVEEQIALLSGEGERKLLQLLYAVDIREAIFMKLISSQNFSKELAQEIVKREALKVYIRNNYKQR